MFQGWALDFSWLRWFGHRVMWGLISTLVCTGSRSEPVISFHPMLGHFSLYPQLELHPSQGCVPLEQTPERGENPAWWRRECAFLWALFAHLLWLCLKYWLLLGFRTSLKCTSVSWEPLMSRWCLEEAAWQKCSWNSRRGKGILGFRQLKF